MHSRFKPMARRKVKFLSLVALLVSIAWILALIFCSVTIIISG